jgi:hypothetical protein
MISVYYPFLCGAKSWEELRYSLRSLCLFLEPEFEVCITGDLPPWVQNVRHIPHAKNLNVRANCTYDAISKLTTFLDNHQCPESFIRMYDDIYLLKHTTLSDLQVTRTLFSYDELHDGRFTSGGSVWNGQVLATSRVARRMGYEGYMTETHCPEVFVSHNLRKIFERVDVLENRLLTSTLYFNMFPFEKRIQDRKTERALFYGADNDFSYASTPQGFDAIKSADSSAES